MKIIIICSPTKVANIGHLYGGTTRLAVCECCVSCQHCLDATSLFSPLHFTNVQYLLRPHCCNLCCNHSACPNLTALIPPAIGSEVGVSLLAGTFYLIKVQPKWNLRNGVIWSKPALRYCISDVLWPCLRGEARGRAAVGSRILCADRSRLTNSQRNYSSEHHTDSTLQSLFTQIKI